MKRALLVLVLLTVLLSPCYATGRIKLTYPGRNYQTFIDNVFVDVSSQGKVVIVRAGDHEIVVVDKDGNTVISDLVAVDDGKVVEVDITSELRQTIMTTQVGEPVVNKSESAAAASRKYFTIRPFITLVSAINADVSNNNYNGTGSKGAYKLDLAGDPGLGIAFDCSVWGSDDKTSELLAGGAYSQNNIRKMNGKGTLTGSPSTLYKDAEVNIQSMFSSIYLKYRYLLNMAGLEGTNMYLGGKLSYNMITLSGDIAGSASLFGGGVFTGIILYDQYDIEIAFDTAQGQIDKFNDGIDNLKGALTMSSMLSASLGYRF